MIELTKRLQAVADLVPKGLVTADVGCDHGYVSIYLIQRKRVPRVIAMDVNEGPLKQAELNISMCGLSEVIETRLSDGLSALVPGEAECVVLAGMGGPLMWRILTMFPEVTRRMKYLILQPQSEIPVLRKNLRTNGFEIEAENMVLEDGKYYPMMRVKVSEKEQTLTHKTEILYDLYGEYLLTEQNEILHQFLQFEKKQYEEILLHMEGHEKRREEIKEILLQNANALTYFQDKL